MLKVVCAHLALIFFGKGMNPLLPHLCVSARQKVINTGMLMWLIMNLVG